jgi:membrane protease subunit (stomatin/prohibitin family)
MFNKLRGEFIDIIEWTEPPDNQLMAYRFPRYNNEIKYGAKLTVREGQSAIFVNQGKLADVFQPGMYGLNAPNLPILSTLMSWPYGFESPFKAEVYFISMKRWTDQKWGTQNPIMLRDPEFGPVRIRAFGTYAIQVSDPKTFLQQLVATDPNFETFEITGQLRSLIVSRFTDAIGELKIGVLDMAGNYAKVATEVQTKMAEDFVAMGLRLALFAIENISLPEEVEKALDTRTKMGVIGDMGTYTRYQTANAIGDAAANPGGIGGVGAQMAVGVAMGSQMAGAMGAAVGTPGGQVSPGVAVPPPLPANVSFFLAIDGNQAGPFDLAGLQAKVAEGKLRHDTLVWKQGMPSWAAASSVPELQSLLASVPPPLPG